MGFKHVPTKPSFPLCKEILFFSASLEAYETDVWFLLNMNTQLYTHVYSTVYPCILNCIPMYTNVYPSIPMCTLAYPCVPLYTLVYLCIPSYTLVYPSIPLCTLAYPSIPFYINNSLHLARKYARIFVRGHYLFREANSFPKANLEENCELRILSQSN